MRSTIVAAAEADYAQGVSAMAAGSHGTAMTWFDSAYTKVMKY